MIFDSEKHKQQVRQLVGASTLEITVDELLKGPPGEIVELVEAIDKGSVLSPEVTETD